MRPIFAGLRVRRGHRSTTAPVVKVAEFRLPVDSRSLLIYNCIHRGRVWYGMVWPTSPRQRAALRPLFHFQSGSVSTLSKAAIRALAALSSDTSTPTPQDPSLLWAVGGRHRYPERFHFLKIIVQRRHTTPLRPMPQHASIFRSAHKRAARTATTPRQSAKVQPAPRRSQEVKASPQLHSLRTPRGTIRRRLRFA